MTLDQIILSSLLAAVLALFIWGRWRYDVVAFGALLVATVAGVVPPEGAFSGFGHPATVTVASVLVISRGLRNSGAIDLIANRLLPPLQSTTKHVGLLSSVSAALSSLMNNVGALALLMPAALQSAAKIKRPPATILMPLSFGSILGGLITLIGTPPNIIVASFRTELVGSPFGMFDFTPVGLTVAVVGLLFIALVGWRLIPQSRRARLSPSELFQIEGYVSEAVVPPGSDAANKALSDLDDMAAEHDAVLIGLIRDGRRVDRAGRNEQVREGDAIIIEAAPDALGAVLKALHLDPMGSPSEPNEERPRRDMSVAEAVVQTGARIVGRTAGSLGLRTRHRINLLAVARQGHAFRGRLKTLQFRPGDVLLLEGDADQLPEIVSSLGCLPLAKRELLVGRPRQVGLSILIFAAAITCATLGLLNLPIALALAAVAMVVLNIVPPRDVYDGVDWPVVVLLASMIPIGVSLDQSGATNLVAASAVSLFGDANPAILLALLLVITMTLSDIINNAATAIVMAPIAANVASRLGADPDPFLMAVAIGASSAFLTPIGHQNNMLIMGPAGYRFGDYWRMGLPLEVLIVLVAIPMLLWIWPM